MSIELLASRIEKIIFLLVNVVHCIVEKRESGENGLTEHFIHVYQIIIDLGIDNFCFCSSSKDIIVQSIQH